MESEMRGGAAVTFEQREAVINNFIDVLVDRLENYPCGSKYFTTEEYMAFYTIVYDAACTKEDSHQEKLYYLYERAFMDYISSKVLPSLQARENEDMLKELSRRWNNYKTMTRLLSGIFHIILRTYVHRMALPSLERISYLAFYNGVCVEIKDQIRDAIISLVNREREGEKIDRTVVKQALDMFTEIGGDTWQCYTKRVEIVLDNVHKRILDALRRSSKTPTEVYGDYVLQVERCFEQEETKKYEHVVLKEMDKFLMVHREIKNRIRETILSKIDREADPIKMSMLGAAERLETCTRIQRAAPTELQKVLEEIGDGAMKIYSNGIDEALIEATALFYSDKASDWIASLSYKDYMLKAEECLEKEKNRAVEYLKIINKDELLEVVRHELLEVDAKKLEEMKASAKFIISKL